MEKSVTVTLNAFEKAVKGLEKKFVEHEKRWTAQKGEPELFSFANENDRQFKKALANKLDNTIERLETLLAEE